MPKFIEFWDRDSGALWLPIEHKQIKQFTQVRPNQHVSISGYVKWISDTIFALVPTPFSNQTYLICRNYTGKLPDQNSFIMVDGNSQWNRLHQAKPSSRLFRGDLVIDVTSWRPEKPILEHTDLYEYFGLSKDYSLEDFKRDLLYPIEDLDPEIGDFLTFSMLGTSSFEQYMGGVNLTLYDATESGMSKRILQQLKRLIPSDMNKQFAARTPYGDFGLRYDYGFLVGNADSQLTPTVNSLLENRTRSNLKFRQASLSLYSRNRGPLSFKDKPCALCDIPTVVPETTGIQKISFNPDYDSFKFMLIQHMHQPQIPRHAETLTDLSRRMEELVESYDLDHIQLTQHGFLNANVNARPTSIFRQSLAHIRAHKINTITSQEMRKGLDYFEWNLEYVYEIWEDLFKEKTSPSYWQEKAEYRKIRRIIRRYDQGNGVSEEIIKEEAGMKTQKAIELLNEMYRIGWIYARGYKCWRLTKG